MEVMRVVIHEAGQAPRPVAPAEARAIAQLVGADAGDRYHAILRYAAHRRQVGVERIQDRIARNRLDELMQIIRSDDAGIPGAEIARIEIIAHRPVDAFRLLPALVEGAAIIDPKNIRLRGLWNRISAV